MSETRNLGELFQEALKKNLTEKQKNPKRTKKRFTPTGIAHVTIINCSGCTQGFMYQYSTMVDKNKISFRSVDILKVKAKARGLNLEWAIENEFLARKVAQSHNLTYEDLIK